MPLPIRALFLLPLSAMPILGFAQDAASPDQWSITGGLGVLTQPEYAGSDRQKVTPAPFVVAAKGRWMLGAAPGTGIPFGVAATLWETPVWKFGAAVGGTFVKEREEADDARLIGLGDIDGTARAALYTSATVGWFKAMGSVSSDIGGRDQGIEARLGAEARMPISQRLSVTVGAGVTFADQRRQQTFFGIDTQQSARSGRPTYRPDGGLQSVRVSLSADYQLAPSWVLGGKAELASLRGDAATSPITQDKRQDTAAVFIRYRF